MDIDKNLAKSVAHEMINSLFVYGKLTESDLNLSKKDFLNKFRTIIHNCKYNIIVDYRPDILLQAEAFFENKNYEYAKIFYAMFFEHSLNSIIEKECNKRNIDEKMGVEIIKSIGIQGKLTWLLALLGFKRFNHKHLTTIKNLIDNRNAFIHYKWKSNPNDDEDNSTQIQMEFKKIKLAVKYMKYYETSILYNKNKGKLISKLKFPKTNNLQTNN